jgi:hypothetical protein
MQSPESTLIACSAPRQSTAAEERGSGVRSASAAAEERG